MKTTVLKMIEGRVSLGNQMMTKAGVSKGSDCITILVHGVPDEVPSQQVARLYEQAIIIPQEVFEFSFDDINVKPGTIIWLDESRRPDGILKNGIAKVRIVWDNEEESTIHLSGKLTLKENLQQTIDLMHGEGKGLNLMEPDVLMWYKNRQSFVAHCGPEIYRYDRHSN